MTRKELLENIEKTGHGEYHDLHTVRDAIHTVYTQYGNDDDCVVVDGTLTDEVRDQLSWVCDSATPIYDKDRAKWFGENWSAYDEIMDELGRGDNVMDGIGIAYCLTLEREVAGEIEFVAKEIQE